MAIKKPRAKAAVRRGSESGIGERIKSARESRGWTQVELSSRSGVDRGVIAGYEKGNYVPGGREIRRLCDALQVSPSYLLYGSETPFPTDAPMSLVQSDEAFAIGMSVFFLESFNRKEQLALLGLLQAIYEAKRGPEDLRETSLLAAVMAEGCIGRVDYGLKQIQEALRGLKHKKRIEQRVSASRKQVAASRNRLAARRKAGIKIPG